MDKQEIKGKAQKAKGAVKEKVGELAKDRELEAEGAADRAEGAVRDTVGKGKRKVGEVIDEAMD